ncbi:10119_t:CDS:10 [Ambispora leptoticha]|uniref:CTP synthase n=1 Tax=Ambispora leptoticha TaxID=144679 RepID=A0A9N9A5U7_9GLOM|nr:10119_t:CDS:10 [Ambispora leptoticha]
MTKYIFFTYGIIAGYQKGLLAASTALLLKSLGLKVTAARIDPFIQLDGRNLDPGYNYLLEDGGIAVEELGNYERFLDTNLDISQYITSGQVFNGLVEKERAGEFLGRSVLLVGDGTDKMQEFIEKAAIGSDICVFELGAEIDLPDTQTWLEAIDEFQDKVGVENVAFVHVVPLLALPNSSVATITKPAFDSHRSLITNGTTPDLIACICSGELTEAIREKICFEPTKVIPIYAVPTSYHLPFLLERENVLEFLTKRLRLDLIDIDPKQLIIENESLGKWKNVIQDYNNATKFVTIAIIGKFKNQQDLHHSISQALEHASIACGRKLILKWIEATHLEPQSEINTPHQYREALDTLFSANGILVPDGFAHYGIDGILLAAKSAREREIPFLGISLGFLASVMEFARNVCGLTDANSEELDKTTTHKVFIKDNEVLGRHHTNFLDVSECWSKIRRLYEISNNPQSDIKIISERHHHRYKLNIEYLQFLEDAGLIFVGSNETAERMEIFELKDHPFYAGTQFHPEYKSRPFNPSPVFLGFVLASSGLSIQWYMEKQSRSK